MCAIFAPRFHVKPDAGEAIDCPSWGVWDVGINAWRSRDLTYERAERHAADLELQYDAYGARAAANRRPVSPGVQVEAATWAPAGVLDYWLRDAIHRPTGGPGVPAWYGRVRTSQGRYDWILAGDLRRVDSP